MSPPLVLSSCTIAALVSLLLLVLAADRAGAAAVDTTLVAVSTTADPTATNTDAIDHDLQLIKTTNEDIYSFVVHSKIRYRYAQTVVSSRVINKGNTSHEVQFYVTLPESAFVSKFLMVINEKEYEAYVKEKNEAKSIFNDAVNSGRTAAHVEQNARDSNQFTVSVNVEAESKVTFNLTYEQLLSRKLGFYENIINLQPGQVIKNMQVIVDIDEASNITTLEVPDIKTTNEIATTISKNKFAKISRESGNKATITWSPNVKEQKSFSTKHGVDGQFIVKYDVDHQAAPNQVLIDDGYFVHFFAPTELKPLRTHVIFVLDVSGSMSGRKLSQVKDAMDRILSEINSDDFFSLISFSDYAMDWKRENVNIFPATEQNIKYAKEFIRSLQTDASTNMEDALNKAHEIAKSGETRFNDGVNVPKPIIVFLTDGQPNLGSTNPQKMIKYDSKTNKEERYPVYSLGFGEGADINFLKVLSLNNNGFARVIYEASVASLQLRNFYKELSSPVLSNVKFQYIDAQVDNTTVTTKSFNLLFKGTELVVAGKLKNATSPDFNSILNADSKEGKFEGPLIVTCFDLPLNPSPTPIAPKTGHLEKLWAYLSIQQLMDKYELNKNEHTTAKDEALKLALKYSFVTSLTSLVVVKPNDTSTSVALEKINPISANAIVPIAANAIGSNYNFKNVLLSSQPQHALFDPMHSAMWTDINYDDSYRAIDRSWTAHHPFNIGDSQSFFSPMTDTSDLFEEVTVDSDRTLTAKSDKDSIPELHSIDELTWLGGASITLNETNTVYRVLLNTSGQTYQNCTTPAQMHGNCKHLKDCVISSILASIDTYLPLFCPIETLYAGICCLV